MNRCIYMYICICTHKEASIRKKLNAIPANIFININIESACVCVITKCV